MIALENILKIAANYRNIPVQEIQNKSRKRKYIDIKKAFVIYAAENTRNDYNEIAKLIGNDRTMVYYYLNQPIHIEIKEIVMYLKSILNEK